MKLFTKRHWTTPGEVVWTCNRLQIISWLVFYGVVFFALGVLSCSVEAQEVTPERRATADAFAEEISWYMEVPWAYAEAVYGKPTRSHSDRSCQLDTQGWLVCYDLASYTYDLGDREVTFTVDQAGVIRGVSGGLYYEDDPFTSSFPY